jgi:hypothetical protein
MMEYAFKFKNSRLTMSCSSAGEKWSTATLHDILLVELKHDKAADEM